MRQVGKEEAQPCGPSIWISALAKKGHDESKKDQQQQVFKGLETGWLLVNFIGGILLDFRQF